MTRHQDEQEPAFKVVDKRRFTEEGEERLGVLAEDKPKEKPAVSSPPPVENASSEKSGMNFLVFVQSLVHQAMMGLGLVAWPDSGLVKQDLSLAKQTIDILLILKEKTAGNLSAEEQNLLNGLLYQLQVAFVDVAKTPPSGPNTIIK